MYLWLTLTIAIAAGALFLAGAGTDSSGLGGDHQMAYLTLFGIGMVMAGAVKLLIQIGRNGFKYALSWTAVLGVVFLGIVYRGELGDLYNRATSDRLPSVALSQTGESEETELRRAWDGHYRADAVVNGVPMRLLVDTGASMVLLPFESVEHMGIDPTTLDFNLPVTTANGRSTVAPIRIASISVGQIEVKDVPAAVAHPGRLKSGLLGMSFLDKVDETIFQGDRLILRQNGSGNLRFSRAPDTVNGMFPPEALKNQPDPY